MISSELAMVAPNPLGLEFTIPHKPSGEERAIFDYLATYLPADSAITVDEAVQQIITLFPEELDTTGTSFIYLFWQLVFCIGSQLDYDYEPMQRFIALLRDLEILPDEIQGGAYPGRNSHSSRMYYIFTFADMWRSMLPTSRFSRSGTNRQNSLGTQNSSSKFARQLQNVNGMSAHMHKNGIGVNVSIYALETITKALEDEELSEPYVQAAAVWFTVCPSSIYSFCQDQESKERETRGPLWTGLPQRGYSLSRWMFWRKRFVQICNQPGMEEETMRVCRDAAKGIDRMSRRGIGIKIMEKCETLSQKIKFKKCGTRYKNQ